MNLILKHSAHLVTPSLIKHTKQVVRIGCVTRDSAPLKLFGS